MDDAARLMVRVRTRDAAAFETLYDAHHRLVYGIAMRVLADRVAAEDVTQAVFLKIWSDPNLFRGGNFAGWIARVTRNRAVDMLRKRSRLDTDLGELPQDAGVDEQAFSAIDAQAVRKALAALPAEQRVPIELGFFGGKTHEEISRDSGTPLGTIKTRIRSGLRRLRAELEGGVSV